MMYRLLKLTIVSLATLCLAISIAVCLAYAAPPDGKGPDKDKEPPGQARKESTPPGQQDRTPPGQERAQEQAQARQEQAQERAAEAAANRVEARTQQAEAKAERAERAEIRNPHVDAIDRSHVAEAKVERQHEQQVRQALDRSADDQQQPRADRSMDRRVNHQERAHQAAAQHVTSLVNSLNKLEHARWSFNLHDTRGQGNMGKPTMQDPFGFDKDSGREGRDRGRPIRGTTPEPEQPPANPTPVFDITTDLTSSLQLVDPYVLLYQSYILWYQRLAAAYPALADWYAQTIQYTQDLITARIAEVKADTSGYWASLGITAQPNEPLVVNDSINAMAYTLGLSAPATFAGTTLQVTTTLTSVVAQDVVTWDVTQPAWDPFTTVNHFDAGQVVWQTTEPLTLGADGTATYSYNIPIADAFAKDLTGYGGNYLSLTVTVTDPATGKSYVISDDRLRVYRCPYGIIYDKTMGKPVVGAVVTVHNADGSIAVLDKGANPNVSNPQTTDATGRYNCKLAIGKKYYLTVTAPGYADYRSGLFSERWHIVREDVGMTPLAVQPDATVEKPLPSLQQEESVSETALPDFGVSAGLIPGK